jgi:hypothetical protein
LDRFPILLCDGRYEKDVYVMRDMKDVYVMGERKDVYVMRDMKDVYVMRERNGEMFM